MKLDNKGIISAIAVLIAAGVGSFFQFGVEDLEYTPDNDAAEYREIDESGEYVDATEEAVEDEKFVTEEASRDDEQVVSGQVQEDKINATEDVAQDEQSSAEEYVKDEQVATDSEQIQSEVAGFRNERLLNEHYEKHGIEMGFSSAKEYEQAAIAVVLNKNALHKIEEEDGDDVYYLEETNEFVIVSVDGYIRTYFNPSGGINYYNRQ